MPKKVCIVTPLYISINPRVVKEADALCDAGFDVKVVFTQGNLINLRHFDERTLKDKRWRHDSVGWSSFNKGERLRYYIMHLRHIIAGMFPRVFWPFGKAAEHAEGWTYRELASLAASERADIYIGHYPVGLAAAAYAASKWKAKFAYDVEDFHTGEDSDAKDWEKRKERIGFIEARYIRSSSYISAVSGLIADEIVKSYNVAQPVLVYNAFPWADRARADGMSKDRVGSGLSIYWFSQFIGEDRGIQDAIMAAGLLKHKGVQIHLRGDLCPDVKMRFMNLARENGVENNLYFHPQVPPEELLSRAIEHDIGLALDRPINLNRDLTVSNKVLFYMLAGLAIIATDTSGHRAVMSGCQDAGFIYPSGDYRALAGYLDKLISDPALLQRCRQASLKAAREKWNWENESKKLVMAVERVLK